MFYRRHLIVPDRFHLSLLGIVRLFLSNTLRCGQGDEAAANEFRLLDPDDTSDCTSVQFCARRPASLCAVRLSER